MNLNWRAYFIVMGFIALFLIIYESDAFALLSKEDTDVVRVENPSSQAAPEEKKKEILDGEFTVINKDQNMNDEKVVKNERQAEEGIIPTQIRIPAIDVDASVEEVGVLENGEMGVPEDPLKAGWFEPGTQPGNRGNSVIAGHVDSRTGPAVFYNLDQLKKGDEITVTAADGEEKTYVVQKLESYPQDNSPIERIFGSTNEKRLNLITCTGEFIRNQGGHQDRLVVYSTLKEPVEEVPVPTNVKVSGAFVTWYAVREENIAGYRVYESRDGGETFEKVASVSQHERKAYSDPKASEYQYYVTTVNKDGQESTPSPISGGLK
ncbi:class F sortase [Halobacillus litoralis]|uniref:class F sortase n=1 Tax=Halobacillus litoralis TaxID=45668 RepID=UPI001CD2CA41|nr:class F sortase [Halobacillus litoralis]MCA0970994.1 class F sortase [Halobacillus litoralis]